MCCFQMAFSYDTLIESAATSENAMAFNMGTGQGEREMMPMSKIISRLWRRFWKQTREMIPLAIRAIAVASICSFTSDS